VSNFPSDPHVTSGEIGDGQPNMTQLKTITSHQLRGNFGSNRVFQ
jgi:hypothetical protein